MSGLSDTGKVVAETAERIFAAHCTTERLLAAEGGWNAALWQELTASGIPLALEPRGAGSLGIPPVDALNLVRVTGRFAAPAPLAETMLANWLALSSGMAPIEGAASIAGADRRDRVELRRLRSGWRIFGTAAGVPWARFAATLLVVAEVDGVVHMARVGSEAFAAEPGENIAREPRDRVSFEGLLAADAVVPVAWPIAHLRGLGAAIRVLQMSGALDAVLELTVRYAGERVQFGRPIGKFQAVQQNIALMGAQVATARAAAGLVAQGFGKIEDLFNVAAAKSRVAEAAIIATRYAHQVHGAIGITQEYGLHFLTKRLWAWRDEFGNEAEWARILGREILRQGADHMWPFLTSDLRTPLAAAQGAVGRAVAAE